MPTRRLHASLALASLALPAASWLSGASLRFDEVAQQRGVDFEHDYFGDGSKHMPENMGAGVAVFDYDGDGDLDLYFVQGAPVVGDPPPSAANRLYRQEEDGSFVDVTERAGAGDRGVGMGVSIGDVDADGSPDLYVTNYGANALLRNRGDGTFEDVTVEFGVGGDAWSTGSAFVDLDGDGDEDLYVANYLAYDADDAVFCGNAQTGLRAYCHPDLYRGQRDAAYLNQGEGPWREAADDLGLLDDEDSRGLGVLAADLDGDGAEDVYVANDTTANHLYLRTEEGLREGGLLAGVAVNGSGAGEASMGLAFGDLDSDGRRELFATHLDEETNTLYRPSGSGLYRDATEAAGLAVASRLWVGFGTAMADFDLDGDLDLAVTNGHIIDNIALFDPALSHAQPLQLFENDGSGRMRLVADAVDSPPLVGRGLAVGDLDRDGDADFVVTQNGGPARLFDNLAVGGDRSLVVTAAAASDRPDRWWSTAQPVQARWLERPPSYLSQGALEIAFVARAKVLDLERAGSAGRRRYRGLRAGARYRFR